MRRHPTARRAVTTALIAALTTAAMVMIPAGVAGADTPLEAESMALTAGAGAHYSDAAASGGRALLVRSNGTASAPVTTAAVGAVRVRARGTQCSGAPRMTVRINDVVVLTVDVTATRWTDYSASAAAPAGTHKVSISYDNDLATKRCDRDLRLDRVIAVDAITTTTTTAPTTPSPALDGATLYVDPHSNAAREAAALRSSDPARALLFDKVAGQSQADWVGDWVPASELATHVSGRIATINASGAVPVFVAYAIPLRDCGSYSAGGVGTPEGYRAWVRQLAAGIGGRKAAVILEPDALGQISCLTSDQQHTRLTLLSEAVNTLTASGATVYLDAGHSAWVPADTMAARLQAAGVAGARGFSLNVSNFQHKANEITYGLSLAERLGGKSFVIDTSRNGAGPYAGTDGWCNPPERALGERPTTSTGVTGLDALLWVKRPGESDGTCRNGPSAGTWWPDYAAGLAERAAF